MSGSITVLHEWFAAHGGAEDVALEIGGLPGAHTWTTVSASADLARLGRCTMSPLQSRAVGPEPHVALARRLPAAMRSLRPAAAPLFVRSHHHLSFLCPPPECDRHVVYVHSPPRFLWEPDTVPHESSAFGIDANQRAEWRRADYESMAAADIVIANSAFTRDRIQRFYNRDAVIVPPPVRRPVVLAQQHKKAQYLVTVGRLAPAKRLDLVIRAADRTRSKLIVIGSGREMSRLRRLAGPQVRFVGSTTGHELVRHVAAATAFVSASQEDFGIAAVEALALGTPVIAYRDSALRDIVRQGESGFLYEVRSIAAIAEAIEQARAQAWDAVSIAASAAPFAAVRFRDRLREVLDLHGGTPYTGSHPGGPSRK